MENTHYTIRLEPKSPGTINVDRIKEKLQQRGFQEIEALNSNEFQFALNKPAYVLQARVETDSNHAYAQRVFVSLDTRRLLMEALSSAAAELSGVACSLACSDDMPQMSIHYEDAPAGQPQDCLERDNPCDLCSRVEEGILQKKTSLRRFPAISAAEAQKWMNDFPQRRERFVAAIREAKNRDIYS